MSYIYFLSSPLRSVIREGDLNKSTLSPTGVRNPDFLGSTGGRNWFNKENVVNVF